jgi:hypothetical protein
MVAAAGMAGCGVPIDDTARVRDPLPAASAPSAAPTQVEVSVYLALKTELIPVPRLVDASSVASGVLEALVLGPSAAESAAGLTSPVAATGTIGSQDPEVEGGRVTVVLAEEFGNLPLERQVLGLGQTVLSLTGSGLTSVSFVDSQGKAVSVPVADGTIVDRALVRGDYESLIAGAPPAG